MLKTFYWIITVNIFCSLHDSEDYDFHESFENHLKIAQQSFEKYLRLNPEMKQTEINY